MSLLYLVRHPLADVAPNTCYGNSDVGLVEDVAGCATRLRTILPREAMFVSSPLRRCLELAQALGKPFIEPRLREIDFGAWELRRFDEIPRDEIDAWAAEPLSFRPPDGETVSEMATRAIAALSEWTGNTAAPVVFISHGGPLRAIAGHLLGFPEERWSALDFGYGTATCLELVPEWGARLKWFNR